jgi:hypothetical protein
VRNREIAFALQSLLLNVAPVVIGAPDNAAGEARLERDGARAVISAQGDALYADALRVDIVARLQPIDDAARPILGFVDGVQTLQPQRFARAGLIDDQRRNAPLGQPMRKPDAVLHLLGGIEPLTCTSSGAWPAAPAART